MKPIVLLTTILLLPAAAFANCARDVADMTPKVAQIKDAKTRARAENYLQRASRELQENDEFECQSAIGAIEKLMPRADRK